MPYLFLLALLLGLDFVAFQPVRLAISDWPENYKIAVTIAYWMVPIGLVIWWQTYRKQAPKHPIRAVFFIIYFAKFLLLVFVFLFQLGSWLLSLLAFLLPSLEMRVNRTPFIAQLGILSASIPMALLIYGIIRNRHRYKVYQVEVPILGLPTALNGLRIVQISDIHSGSFTEKEPIQKGIDLINQAKPDLVFFTGDLVNSVATEIEPYVEVFRQIKAKYGVFSVLGNHDYGDYVRWPSAQMKIDNLNQLIETQKKMGWQLLRNERRLVTINGEKVAIIGVENYSASPRFSKYGDLAKAHRGTQNAVLILLLSHDPSHWEAQVVPDFSDIAITFSGHTHGAQFGIELGNWFKWSPVQYVYKQWAGLYQKGRQFLYVNRGFGYLAYPGRVGILPEITLMTLKRTF